MMKFGRYRVNETSHWENWGTTDYRMSTLLPEVMRSVKDSVQLKRRSYFGHPLTIDYRPYHRKGEIKCYVLDVCHAVIDENMPGSVVRKMYYDRIMKLYPDALMYGCHVSQGWPILFMDYLDGSNVRSIVGMIMPMNYGNSPLESKGEERFDKWIPKDVEPAKMEVGDDN